MRNARECFARLYIFKFCFPIWVISLDKFRHRLIIYAARKLIDCCLGQA